MRRLTKIPGVSSLVHGLPLITTSDRQTAKALVVTHTTVAATYKEMEDKGKLIKFTSLIGADDKEHPRQVERKPIFKPTKPVSLFWLIAPGLTRLQRGRARHLLRYTMRQIAAVSGRGVRHDNIGYQCGGACGRHQS